ncbi:hypothetical protein [Thiohalorhabdus sp.]|uniref:hypothetical protein n=1 Tax=Thiohalorhabdus sp. TaxID=3094134 RepID=UPI002FC2FD04
MIKPFSPCGGLGIRVAVGATLAGGLIAGEASAENPFAVRDLPRGYMLAADTFAPTVPEDKEDQEGALCAGEMGSERDKNVEEGRCAYHDTDGSNPDQDRDQEEAEQAAEARG